MLSLGANKLAQPTCFRAYSSTNIQPDKFAGTMGFNCIVHPAVWDKCGESGIIRIHYTLMW